MDWGIHGQAWAVDLLKQHIIRAAVRHAYLLCGPAGVGRRTLALRFAQALNCTQPPTPGEPCGECRLCIHTERMQQADLAIVQTEQDATSIKVEQIRELQRSLMLTPYEARYRVALLLNFEQATPNSQNALLKTLEEAPEKVILLLTADSPENLLPTVVSRCEILRLRPMQVDTLADVLHQNHGVEPEQASLLAHLAGGRPGTALRLHNESPALEKRTQWLDDLTAALVAGRVERFQLAESISKDKEKMRQVLQAWLLYWRDIMLLSAGSSAPLTNLDRQVELNTLAWQVDYTMACRQVNRLEEAIAGLDANLNTRLLAEVLMLDMPLVRES
jgi:DNA polymerase III subunit delta'